MNPGAPLPAFRERLPWCGGDLQTVRNLITGNRGAGVLSPGERLWFDMPGGDRLTGVLHGNSSMQSRPLAVVVHGLAGGEDSHYVVATAAHLQECGFPVLRLSLRGAGPARETCADGYHAGRTEDFALVLDALRSLAPAGVVAVGYSLGGNMLLKHLGECGSDIELRAAVAISAPIDLAAASKRFLQPRNALYQRWLLTHMKRDALTSKLRLDAPERAAIEAVRTVYEFDDRFVAPRHGFVDAEDYYRRCSAQRFVAGIAVPTLLLHAANDPWIPAEAFVEMRGRAGTHVTVEVTRGGGHVGFHGAGAAARGRWQDAAIARLFAEI